MSPKIHLCLGCFGRSEDGFVSCRGVHNRILHLSPKLPSYKELTQYLENCGLYKEKYQGTTGVKNIIQFLQREYDEVVNRLWTDKQFSLYQKFTIEHKDCGLFLILELDESEEEEIQQAPERISITAQQDSPNFRKLQLLRRRQNV